MAENKSPSELSVEEAQNEMEEQWFPLQPVEIKMLTYTFGLGLILLVVFFFVFGVLSLNKRTTLTE